MESQTSRPADRRRSASDYRALPQSMQINPYDSPRDIDSKASVSARTVLQSRNIRLIVYPLTCVFVIAFGIVFDAELGLPGKLASGLFCIAAVQCFSTTTHEIARQFLLIGYLCLLLEFTFCAVLDFQIYNPGKPMVSIKELPESARIVSPLFLTALIIVGVKTHSPEKGSALTRSAAALATIGFFVMCLFLFTIYFWLPHR